MKKILICTPTYEGKDYALLEFFTHLSQLYIPEGYTARTMVCDNSPSKYRDTLAPFFNIVSYVKPKGKIGAEVLTEAYNLMRKRAIIGGYDYVLTLESDVMIQRDTLWQLLSLDAEVASATYLISPREPTFCMQLGHFDTDTHFQSTVVGLVEGLQYFNGTPVRVFGAGLGCTLIRRSVFEKFVFRYEHQKGQVIFNDSIFNKDLFLAEINNILLTKYILKHEAQDWTFNYKLYE
jgi:hypothetical protein